MMEAQGVPTSLRVGLLSGVLACDNGCSGRGSALWILHGWWRLPPALSSPIVAAAVLFWPRSRRRPCGKKLPLPAFLPKIGPKFWSKIIPHVPPIGGLGNGFRGIDDGKTRRYHARQAQAGRHRPSGQPPARHNSSRRIQPCKTHKAKRIQPCNLHKPKKLCRNRLTAAFNRAMMRPSRAARLNASRRSLNLENRIYSHWAGEKLPGKVERTTATASG